MLGHVNEVADALSRLEIMAKVPISSTPKYLTECFGYDDLDVPNSTFPLKYAVIGHFQAKDKFLQQKDKRFHQSFH